MDVTISISVRQQRFPSRIIKEHFLLLLLKDRVMKTRHSSIFTLWGAATVVHVRSYNRLLHICFDRFLLAFESRDLSQADKRITRVSSFPSFNFWMIKGQVIDPDSKSRLRSKEYVDHGPCMTENFCLWIRIVSKFNPMEGIFLKTSIFNSSHSIFLIFPGLK